MLFFKQIKNEKLNDQAFEQFFKKECHVCSVTIKIIAELDEKKEELNSILSTLEISVKQYEELKRGDICNPEQVFKLCDYLEIQVSDQAKKCPRK